MLLTSDQKSHFVREGYVHLPELVERSDVERALRLIHADLGKGMAPDEMPSFIHRSFCPKLRNTSEILSLFEQTHAKTAAEALIGPGALSPVSTAQIALRFPVLDGSGEIGPHIDGSHSKLNGVGAGKLAHYTLLAMVALSDVPVQNAGNFRVWPGTHLRYASYFREHGPECMISGTPRLQGLPAPVQLLVRAGDVVLSHYQLLHGAANNTWVHPRYAVFFRVYHRAHHTQGLDILTDPWREYAGVSDLDPSDLI